MSKELIEALKGLNITEENAQEAAGHAKQAAIDALEANEDMAAKLTKATTTALDDHLEQLGLPELNRDLIVANLDDVPAFEDTKAVLDKLGIKYQEKQEIDPAPATEGEGETKQAEQAPANESPVDDGRRPGKPLADIVRMSASLKAEGTAERATADAIANKLESMTQAQYDADPNLIHDMMVEVGAASRSVRTWS